MNIIELMARGRGSGRSQERWKEKEFKLFPDPHMLYFVINGI